MEWHERGLIDQRIHVDMEGRTVEPRLICPLWMFVARRLERLSYDHDYHMSCSTRVCYLRGQSHEYRDVDDSMSRDLLDLCQGRI